MDVSIVMPCLNEEESVGICVSKAKHWLERSGRHGEIIVVDNGSSDRSIEIARTAGALVIEESKKGYGNAYLTGLSSARGEYIVMGDSDDTYDFGNLDPLLSPLNDGYDMVIGNRLGGVAKGAMPWLHQHVGTPTFNLMLRAFTGSPCGDSQSGFRAFSRLAYENMALRCQGMEFASEMILNARRSGLRIAEVPITYYPRKGESKLSTLRDGWRHLRFLLASTPTFLFFAPGVLLMLLGALTFLGSLAFPAGFEIGSLTWQPVFASSIFMVVGANALLLGMVAILYSQRIQDSVRRPVAQRWLSFYRRVMKLELVLGLGATLAAAGLAIDLALLVLWLRDASFGQAMALAGLAQTLIVVGINMGLAGFAAVILDPDAY